MGHSARQLEELPWLHVLLAELAIITMAQEGRLLVQQFAQLALIPILIIVPALPVKLIIIVRAEILELLVLVEQVLRQGQTLLMIALQ